MNIRDLVRTEIENTAREQEKKTLELESEPLESLAEPSSLLNLLMNQ